MEVNSLDTFSRAQESGRLWVAVDSLNQPVAFALMLEIDGAAHLEELDVLPAHGRKGLGGALVDVVCAWARDAGYPAVTLSTFRDVPWNGPFYAHHGFRAIDAASLSAGLARLVEKEAKRGLRTDQRAIMRRDL
jgi:GNAT superfamily N-acetyltransferase